MYCKNCGKEVTENEKFCSKCGVKINNTIHNEVVENNNMEYYKKVNGYKTMIYGIAFIILLVIVGVIFFSKQSNESYYINLVSSAIKNYDNRANFDITATTSKSINQVMVQLTPSDNYTTNQYGSFYVYYNLKSKNVIRTTSLDIPLRIFQ